MTGWLAGKRALIVGAGSGIGRATVDAFLVEGAQVAVLDHDSDKCAALRRQLPDTPVIEGDATTRAANDEAVRVAVDVFGGLDTLVNCVGIFDFYRGVQDIPVERIDEAFDEMFRINVLSHIHSVKAAVPALMAEDGASIVLTESTSSYYPGRGGMLYVSSKFAVRGLLTALAHELAPRIRVNGVAPGGTLNTDLRGLDSLDLGTRRLDAAPGRARDLAARTPLGVALSGDDHAWSYVFLASQRSRGITGETIHPDGGFGLRTTEPTGA
jgi:phthalate 3,4-cis-dihydrodiol dehydrogenase